MSAVLSARKPAKFFKLNATYTVGSDAQAEELIDDMACLLTGVEAILQTLIDGLSDEGSQMRSNMKDATALLFSAQYQTEMARNAACAALQVHRCATCCTNQPPIL